MSRMEVPDQVLGDERVTYAALATLTLLYKNVNSKREDRFVWWSIRRMAREIVRKTPAAIRRDIKILEEAGYIRRETKVVNGQEVDGFELIHDVRGNHSATRVTERPGSQSSPPRVTESSPLHYIKPIKEPINNEAKDSSSQMSLIELNETPKLSAKTQQLHQAQELVAEFIKHRARVCKHLHDIGFHPRLRGPLKMPKPKSEHLKVAIKALDTWEPQQIRNAFDFTIFEFRHFTKQTAYSEIGSKWMFWETITMAFRPGVIEHGVKGYERQLDNE